MSLADPNFLAPLHKRLDTMLVDFEPDSGTIWDRDCAMSTYGYGWRYDVFVPVSRGGRDISRQRKPFKRRHRNIVSPSNARLEHTTAPYRYLVRGAEFLNCFRFAMTANTSEFYVYYPAGTELKSMSSVGPGNNRLI